MAQMYHGKFSRLFITLTFANDVGIIGSNLIVPRRPKENKMNEPYMFKDKEILHGALTESGNYQCTRVNGWWYYHPADNEWLTYNFNADFSNSYKTEADALKSAEDQELDDDLQECLEKDD